MSYPDAAAALARSLADLTATGAGAHLAPTPSPASDEVALHAALRARNEILTLVTTITTDIAPVTDRDDVQDALIIRRLTNADQVAAVMGLGRFPAVAAFTTTAQAHPHIPVRIPDADPALSTDPRTTTWVRAGEQALLAHWEYARAGGARTDAQRWSAASDAGAIAVLLTQLDADIATSLPAHPLAHPGALAALDHAQRAGPHLAESARQVRADTAHRPHHPYATVAAEPHRVVRVDSPATLVRAQRRLASLIADAKVLSPTTLAQVLATQERLATTTATALRAGGTDPTRAAAARSTAATLAAADTQRVALVTTLTSLEREDPAPAVQNQQIARYLRAMTPTAATEPRALVGALDATPAILRAVVTSAQASTASGTWLTSDPVSTRAQGPLGSYPWQRAEPATIAALTARISLAANHHTTHAARPPAATRQAPGARPAHELLRDALARRPATPSQPRGSRLGR